MYNRVFQESDFFLFFFKVTMSHLVAGCDYLFDDDAVSKDQDFGDRGEEQAGSFHHSCPVTKYCDPSI